MATGLLAPSAQARPTVQAQRGAVDALLRGAHPHITAERLRQIGPDVESILRQAATAPDRGAQPAVRALALLGHFRSAPTAALLRGTLRDAKLPVRLRRVAGSALLRSQGLKALKDARAMLGHEQVFLREAAAIALGSLPDPRATKMLRERSGLEPEAFVRDAIQTALGRHMSAAKAR